MATVSITIVPGGYEVIARDDEGATLSSECRDFGDEMNPDEVVMVLALRALAGCHDMNRDPEWRYPVGSKTQPAHVYRCGFPQSLPLCGGKHGASVARTTILLSAANPKRMYPISKCADCKRLLSEFLTVKDDREASDE